MSILKKKRNKPRGRWVSIKDASQLPDYMPGYVWKFRTESGLIRWSSFGPEAPRHLPKEKIVAYFSCPDQVQAC